MDEGQHRRQDQEHELAGPESQSHLPGFARPLMVIGAALALYILSLGPACKLCEHGAFSKATLRAVYAPLVFVSKNSRVCGQALDWYVKDVWGVN